MHAMLVKNELRIDSRLLSPRLDIRHRQLIDNIRKYKNRFESLGVLPFETEKHSGSAGGRPDVYALLNEDQSIFLLSLSRNTDAVVDCKLELVKAFRAARNALVARDSVRADRKSVRAQEVSAIAKLVEYATDKGSKSAQKYYMAVTKMTNEALGLESGQRDTLDADTLSRISLAEKAVDIAIRDGIRANLEYKDIYRLAKTRCAATVGTLSIK